MKKSFIAMSLIVCMAAFVLATTYEDSDGGFNPFIKGSYMNDTDFCLSSDYLMEFTCVNGSCVSQNVSCSSYNSSFCQYGECVYGNNWCSGSDLDHDAVVDLDDFITLKANYGSTGCSGENMSWCNNADINKDTYVNLDDFVILQQNYGSVNCSA